MGWLMATALERHRVEAGRTQSRVFREAAARSESVSPKRRFIPAALEILLRAEQATKAREAA